MSINGCQFINGIKHKKHMMISIDREHTFIITVLEKIGLEGTSLNVVKALCDEHTANCLK